MVTMQRQLVSTLLYAGLALVPLAAIASPQGQTPLLPPWSEGSSTVPMDDWATVKAPDPTPDGPAGADYQSVGGGLPVGPQHGLVMDGIEVLLASGTLAYGPEPDLMVNNPQGSDALFQRSYRSNCAIKGYGSPGLPPGWVHNYDVKIITASPSGTWGPLNLIYPTGSEETLTPVLDGSGAPTGEFKRGPVPYSVTGTPGTALGTWKEIVLGWNDAGDWRFRPSLLHPGTYPLHELCKLVITYDGDGRIKSIANAGFSTPNTAISSNRNPALITWSYNAAGYLQSISDCDGRTITYDIEPSSGSQCLDAVSFISTKNQVPDTRPHFTFLYSSVSGQMLMTQLTTPSPSGKGRSVCSFAYADGQLTRFTSPTGSYHEYLYGDGSTVVNIKEASGTLDITWTQLWDSLGRNTGNIDARGNKLVVGYQ